MHGYGDGNGRELYARNAERAIPTDPSCLVDFPHESRWFGCLFNLDFERVVHRTAMRKGLVEVLLAEDPRSEHQMKGSGLLSDAALLVERYIEELQKSCYAYGRLAGFTTITEKNFTVVT